MKKLSKLFTLTLSGSLFACILYQSYQVDNILDTFYYIVFGGILLITFYKGIFSDIEKYKKTNSLKSYYVTFIGSLFLILNIAIYSYFENKVNSPNLLKAQNHGVYAYFKKNGKYLIKSGSWGGKKHFYGNYSIKDSVITVDRDYFDKVITTNKFVIRKIKDAFNENDDGKIKNYLVEIDKNGHDKNNDYLFEIVEDNRK
jgi:hypothetical protein